MNETLKPCPFCGHVGVSRHPVPNTHCNLWFLQCEKCHAQGPRVKKTDPHMEAWNRRDDSTLATLRALRSAVEAAPHAMGCGIYRGGTLSAELGKCTCWRSRALALSAQEPASAWRAMDSAPKDGTFVLLYIPCGNEAPAAIRTGGFFHGKWLPSPPDGDEWYWTKPTHWQPLPPPPALAPTEGEGAK
jgi:Lar family restriction alleviation protein